MTSEADYNDYLILILFPEHATQHAACLFFQTIQGTIVDIFEQARGTEFSYNIGEGQILEVESLEYFRNLSDIK